MKTYFEIADEYAKEMFPDHEYITDWYSFLNYYADKHVEWFGQYYMVLAKCYAHEVAEQALNNAAENASIDYGWDENLETETSKINKESITDPKNIQL